MSGRDPSRPVATPSGFFVLRTPLLPFTDVLGWGQGLQAPTVAEDPGVLDEAVVTDRGQLRRPARGHRNHAGIPGRLVRRLTEPGGSGRPVAQRPG